MLSMVILKKLNAYLKKHKGFWLMDKVEKSVPKLGGYILSKSANEDEENRLNAILKKKKPFFHKLQDLKESSEEKNGKKQKYSKICKDAFVSKQTFYDIYRKDVIPSKDTVLKLAFTLKASYDEAKTLLNYAGYTFGDCVYRDLILKFCFENKVTDIDSVNEILKRQNQRLLVEEAKKQMPRKLVVLH